MLSRGVRGIVAEGDDFSKELLERVRNSGRRFERRRLEILSVKGNLFTEELAELSAGLVWLRWFAFPHRVLPPWLSLNKLRILDLSPVGDLEEVWSETAKVSIFLFCRGFYAQLHVFMHLLYRLVLIKNERCCSHLCS